MTEKPSYIPDLKNQRLRISTYLGNDFLGKIEKKPTNDEPQLLADVRSKLSQNPEMHIIGYNLQLGEGLTDIERGLCNQMGLPPEHSNLKDVRNRLAGQEDNFLLVIMGLDRLPDSEQNKIKRHLKGLEIEELFG